MSISVEGVQDIEEEIQAYIESLDDIRSLYDKIQQELQTIADDAVNQQKSAVTGRGFLALTEASQEILNKPARPALRPTRVIIDFQGGDDAIISSDLPYDYIHQFGNPNNTLFGHAAPIRSRAFFPVRKDNTFTKRFEDKLEAILSEWIDEKLEENR